MSAYALIASLAQLLYLGLVFGGYYLYSREIFPFLPVPHAQRWHEWVIPSTPSTVRGLSFFLEVPSMTF